MKKIEAGDIITCPKCNLLIGKFEVDIIPGTILTAEMVTSYIGEITNGMPMVCPKCQTSFYNSVIEKIHLARKGWY